MYKGAHSVQFLIVGFSIAKHLQILQNDVLLHNCDKSNKD